MGLGFEFGLQRIRDLFVVRAYKAINSADKDPFNNQTVKSKFSFLFRVLKTYQTSDPERRKVSIEY